MTLASDLFKTQQQSHQKMSQPLCLIFLQHLLITENILSLGGAFESQIRC